ncbi:MAG: spore germination protein [Sporomusaceae bacterium]|nr:spore germination protein [Sporomusaceae bacterium]
MTETIIYKIYRTVRSILVFRDSRLPSRFVLNEHKPDDRKPPQRDEQGMQQPWRELDALLRAGRRLAALMEQAKAALEQGDRRSLAESAGKLADLNRQQQELQAIFLAYESGKTDQAQRLISASLEENVIVIKRLYGLPENEDLILRSLEINGQPPRQAMLLYLDGMVDKQVLNLSVLQPLIYCSRLQAPPADRLLDIIAKEYLPVNQTTQAMTISELADGINSGDTAMLIEGIPVGLLIDSKGYKQRGLERPQNEQTVRGSQVAFSEGLRVNTALLRSALQTSDLVTEIFLVGDRVPQKCALMYVRSIANPSLVSEARRRLNGISTDYVYNLGVLEQFIEDHPSIPLPQMLSTERPDRVAAGLMEGRLALLMEGVPFVNLFPVTLFNFFHSAEDWAFKAPIANFARVLRWVATLLTLILPSMYLAISYFHQEAMPTALILAVAAARENVPFPAVFEILMMEFAFELIREAGWRVPGALGSTIGIVGAIILGQAAVSANLVSPIMVVIIALTGLASFVIPEYRIASSIRLLRFLFLLLAGSLGLVGLSLGMLVLTVIVCGMKSFGVPFMSPVAPKTIADFDVVLRGKAFNRDNRPDELNTRDAGRQPAVSNLWAQRPPVDKESES